jgi:hypothetical protein
LLPFSPATSPPLSRPRLQGLSFPQSLLFVGRQYLKIIIMKVRTLPSLLGSLGVVTVLFSSSQAQITVYYPQAGAQAVFGTGTGTGAAANYTGAAAYNPTTLNPPSPPGAQALPTQFTIQPPNAVPPGASILQNGSFFGFSIEMSVVNQVG